jgi:hypothetical protein
MTLTSLAIDLLNAARKLDAITAADVHSHGEDGFAAALADFQGVLNAIETALGRT